jgi:nucleotide-binding universal stress UspA family protein
VTAAIVTAVALAGLAAGVAAGWWLPPHGRRPGKDRPRPVRRILVPFTGQAISRRAFEAAVRLAKVDNATIMPAYLARVPRHLPLDVPVAKQCDVGMPLLEAIEQKARAQGVDVDARVSRGRSYRDALQQLLDREDFDRIIVSATDNARAGLSAEDLKWLLERVPAEVMILRPAPDDDRRITGAAVTGHF